MDRDFLIVEKFGRDEDHLLSRSHFLLVPLGRAGLGGVEAALRRPGRVRGPWARIAPAPLHGQAGGDALNLTVNRGDLFGFIGSNGAGKTTTLRILATFLAPSGGTAQVLGHDVVRDADAVRHVIGYMPDFFGVYKDMEVTEYLDFFGACYKIPSSQREKTVNDVLELVGLSEKKGALIGALSRGMQQRLCLAHALVRDTDPLGSHLLLATPGSAARKTTEDDGRLTASEIADLALVNDLVVR